MVANRKTTWSTQYLPTPCLDLNCLELFVLNLRYATPASKVLASGPHHWATPHADLPFHIEPRVWIMRTKSLPNSKGTSNRRFGPPKGRGTLLPFTSFTLVNIDHVAYLPSGFTIDHGREQVPRCIFFSSHFHLPEPKVFQGFKISLVPALITCYHLEMPSRTCLVCKKHRKRNAYQFCSERCTKIAAKKAPQLLRVPKNHVMYQDGMRAHPVPLSI